MDYVQVDEQKTQALQSTKQGGRMRGSPSVTGSELQVGSQAHFEFFC